MRDSPGGDTLHAQAAGGALSWALAVACAQIIKHTELSNPHAILRVRRIALPATIFLMLRTGRPPTTLARRSAMRHRVSDSVRGLRANYVGVKVA